MSLSDVVGGAGVSIWQQIALVLFFVAFAAIVVRVLLARRSDVDRWSRIPIDDDPRQTEPPTKRTDPAARTRRSDRGATP